MSDLPPPADTTPDPIPDVPSDERSDALSSEHGATHRRRGRTLIVAGAVAAIVAIGAIAWAVSRGGSEAGGNDAVEFVARWDRRLPGLGQFDEFDGVQLVGVEDGHVVLAAGFGGQRNGVVVVDAATGDEVWNEAMDTGNTGEFLAAVASDVVLVAAGDIDDEAPTATVTAFDLLTGERRWSVDDVISSGAWRAVGDSVYVATYGDGDDDATLVVLDAATGDVAWERAHSTLPLVVRSNGLVVSGTFGSDERTLVGLDLDGSERWTRDVRSRFALDWQPDVASEVVAVADGGDIVGIGLESGDEVWRREITTADDPDVAVFPRPAIDVDVVCAHDLDGYTVAVVEHGDGAIRWSEALRDASGVAGATDTTIVVLGEETLFGGCGNVGMSMPIGAVAGRSVADGSELWSFERGEGGVGNLFSAVDSLPPVPSSLTIADSDDAQIVVDLTTGDPLASVERGDIVGPSITVRQFGDLVVGVRDDAVFDAADPTRSVEVGGSSFPLGVVDGVLYVRNGSRIIAVD